MHSEIFPRTPDLSATAVPARHKKRRIVLGVLLTLIIVIAVGWLAANQEFFFTPQVSGLITARGLDEGEVIGETQVFSPGEEVFLIFDLSGGRDGQVISIRVRSTDEGTNTRALMLYNLRQEDVGKRFVTFTPPNEGAYQATLFLNDRQVEHAQATFKVMVDGPRLEEIITARAVDEATYRPLNSVASFDPTDTVYITYRAVDTQPDDTLRIEYAINDMVQPSDPYDTTVFSEAGNLRGYFSLQGGGNQPLATGHYRARLFYNDNMIAVVTFDVVE